MTFERTYLSTHPWLTFSANLRSVAPKLWIALGECQSMCDEIAHAALPRSEERRVGKECRSRWSAHH